MTTLHEHKRVLRCAGDDCDRYLTLWLDDPSAIGYEAERWGWAQVGGQYSETFRCFSHRAKGPRD